MDGTSREDPLGLRSLSHGLKALQEEFAAVEPITSNDPQKYIYTIHHLGAQGLGSLQVWSGVKHMELHPAGVVFEDREGREVYLLNVPIKVYGNRKNEEE